MTNTSKCQMIGCGIYIVQLLLIPSVQNTEARSSVQTEMDGSVQAIIVTLLPVFSGEI